MCVCTDFKPGIYKGKESNLVDLEVVPHCPVDCRKDHQGIEPTGNVEKKMERQKDNFNKLYFNRQIKASVSKRSK